MSTETPLHILVKRIYDPLGIAICAKAMGVSDKTAYPYAEPPEKNGVVIPFNRLLLLLEFAGRSGHPECMAANTEIANIVCRKAGVKAIGLELLEHLNVGITALNNGGRLKAGGASCPSCHQELKQKGWIDGQPVYSCPNCRGAGIGAAK